MSSVDVAPTLAERKRLAKMLRTKLHRALQISRGGVIIGRDDCADIIHALEDKNAPPKWARKLKERKHV